MRSFSAKECKEEGSCGKLNVNTIRWSPHNRLLLLGVGCLIDNIPATIILSPILLPIVTNLGMTPIQFGIMLTMNLAIGFVTPPYGIDLFVASAISKEPMSRMIKPTLRFILSLLVVLMLVTFVEPVTMGVLHLMGK